MTATQILNDLPPALIDDLAHAWAFWARDDQWPPEGAWNVWLVLGGRGAGKTRTGAEWVRGLALGQAPFATAPVGRIALIGETQADARDVMVEGVSGLLAVHRRSERPVWHKSLRKLTWPNGAVAQVFSAEEPQALRGPQFGAAWLDELAKWKKAEEAWDMLQFGLRLGAAPRQIVTTTPRPTALLKRLLADPLTMISRARTQANAYNLAPAFLDRTVGRYKGTRLGRQELAGELVEDREDALWSRVLLGLCQSRLAGDMSLQHIQDRRSRDPTTGRGPGFQLPFAAPGFVIARGPPSVAERVCVTRDMLARLHCQQRIYF